MVKKRLNRPVSLYLILFAMMINLVVPQGVYSLTNEEKKAQLMAKLKKLNEEKQKIANKAAAARDKNVAKQDLSVIIAKYEKLNTKCSTKKSDRCADVKYTLSKLYYDKTRDDYINAREKYEKAMDRWEKNPVGKEPINPIPNYNKPLRYYQNAVKEYPNYIKADEAYYQIGAIMMINGEPEKSKKAFLTLVAKKPNSVRASAAHFRIAEFYFTDREFGKALDHLNKVKDSQLNIEVLEMAHFRKAEIYYNRADFDKAVELFSSFVDKCDWGEYPKKDLREEALEYVAIAFSDMPNGAEAALAHFKKVGGRPYENYVVYEVGMKNFNHGQYEQAISALSTALKKYPLYKEAPVAQQMVIACHVIRKEYDEANVQREKLVDFYGRNSEWAARFVKEPVALEKAAIEVRKALAAIPIYYHAEAQKKKNRALYQKALKRYNEYITKFPEDKWKIYEFKYNSAEIYNKFKQFGKAADNYDFVATADLSTYPAFKDNMDTLGMAQDEIEKKKQQKKKNSPVAISQEDAGYNAIAALDNLRKATMKKQGLKDVQAYTLPATKRFLDYIEKFQSKFPTSSNAAEVLYLAGNVHYAADAFPAAIQVFNKIIVNYPKSVYGNKSLRMIANTYSKSGEFTLAIEKYKQLLALEKPNTPKYKEVMDLAAGSMFKKASKFRKSSDFTGAAEVFKSIYVDFPNSKVADRAWFEAGVSYEKANSLELAAETFKLLGEKFPKSTLIEKSFVRAAKNYEKKKMWVEAAKTYEIAAAKVPKSEFAIPSLSAAADNYKKVKDYKSAANAYETVFKRYPTDKNTPVALYSAGYTYEKGKLYNDAIRLYSLLSTKFPESSDASEGFYSIGFCYEKLKDPLNMAKAFTNYAKKFTVNRSKQVTSLARAAKAYKKLGKNKEALANEQMAVAIYEKFKKKHAIDLVAVSEAYYAIARDYHEKFNKIALTGKYEKNVATKLKEKTKALEPVLKTYAKVIEVGVSEWTLKATYMIGVSFVDFARAYENQKLFGSSAQKVASKIKIISGLEKYYIKAQEKFYWNIDIAYQQGLKGKWVNKSTDAYMKMAYEKGKLFEKIGDIFRNAPIPKSLSKADKMAYKDVLEEKYLEALDAALPKYEEGVYAAKELGIVKSVWLDSIKAKIDYINPASKALAVQIVPRAPKVVEASKTASKSGGTTGNSSADAVLKQALARISNIMALKIPMAEKISQLKGIENDAKREIDAENDKISELKGE